MLQGRKTEERRDLSASGGQVHRADTHLDFRLGLLDILGVWVASQILMRPGMGANRNAGRDRLFGDLRMPAGVPTDLEEGCFQAFVGQRLENGLRVARPRTVVEGQDDFFITQEVILLEMLEAEAGTAGRVDL